MPHTYADLLELVDAAEVVVDQSQPATAGGGTLALPNDQISPPAEGGDDQNGPSGPGAGPGAEADDDPHRLARINLERYATRTDGRTLAYWREEWYVWKHNAYRRISERELRAKLSGSIKAEFDRIAAEKLAAAEAAGRDGGEPIVAQKVTMALVSNVLQATSGMVCISGDIEPNTWLPTKERKNYISMANGLLDVDVLLAGAEGFLLPNSPQWFSMTSLPYDFDPDAKCPKCEAFLNYNLAGDRALIAVAQEWAGYLLLPTTDKQKFMLLEGEGQNGKSVFIAILTALLGEENVSNVPLEYFHDKFQLFGTIGKLLNAAGDTGEIDKAAEGTLKSFTSGDRMYFDRKGISGVNCTPTARLMIACNNRPRLSDHTDGVWRRMMVIPWTIKVTAEKRIDGMDKAAWWRVSGELPGIFCWAVAGLSRLRSQGRFTHSDTMEEVLREYKEDMNPARSFLEQNLEESETGQIRSSYVYKLYRKWIEENGYRPMSERPFGKELKRVFTNSVRRRLGPRIDRYYVYDGIQFSQEEVCGEKTSDNTLF